MIAPMIPTTVSFSIRRAILGNGDPFNSEGSNVSLSANTFIHVELHHGLMVDLESIDTPGSNSASMELEDGVETSSCGLTDVIIVVLVCVHPGHITGLPQPVSEYKKEFAKK